MQLLGKAVLGCRGYKTIHFSSACFASLSKAGVYQQRTVGSIQPAQTHLQPSVQTGDTVFSPVTLFKESHHQKRFLKNKFFACI